MANSKLSAGGGSSSVNDDHTGKIAALRGGGRPDEPFDGRGPRIRLITWAAADLGHILTVLDGIELEGQEEAVLEMVHFRATALVSGILRALDTMDDPKQIFGELYPRRLGELDEAEAGQ